MTLLKLRGMSDENYNLLSLETLLNKMQEIMYDYIALHKQNSAPALIRQKEEELENIHKIIRAKIENNASTGKSL